MVDIRPCLAYQAGMPTLTEPERLEDLATWLMHPPTPQKVTLEILPVPGKPMRPGGPPVDALLVRVGIDVGIAHPWMVSGQGDNLELALTATGRDLARCAAQLVWDMQHYRALKWSLPAIPAFLPLLTLEKEACQSTWPDLYRAWGACLAISGCWARLRSDAVAKWRPGLDYRAEIPL